jgi:hypothetical protein
MKKLKFLIILLAVGFTFNACQKEEYSLGDLTAPTNLVINTEIEGVSATYPYGEGSGNVMITAHADDALAYKIDFGATGELSFVPLVNGMVTKKYTTTGVNDYTITVVAYGKGGTSTVMTKNITVRSDFTPDPMLVTNLTNNASKTWIVDKDVPGHMGVGPIDNAAPVWWQAAINEKVACCNCFYTTQFTFSKSGSNYSLQVVNPDGAFTKTGSLTNLPGIPASGDEGCYAYGGGSGAFTFAPAESGITASTQTVINLASNATYIAYGSCQSSYEIIEITSTYMYLRVQGTETGNAWYFKLKPQS